jgi:hypothetical protein
MAMVVPQHETEWKVFIIFVNYSGIKLKRCASSTQEQLRLYSLKSSLILTLNEWRFNLSFSWVSLLFLNGWRVSVVPYYVTTHPPAIQKQHWPSGKAQIESPLIECEWAFRIRALFSIICMDITQLPFGFLSLNFHLLWSGYSTALYIPPYL